jgi:hypothetical protein
MKSSIGKARVGLVLGGLALGLPWAASPAHAAASTYEVINGGECLPYPPYSPTGNSGGIYWQHFLYAFSNGAAFCHLRMTQEWPVSTLSYVLYNGVPVNGIFTARLCVHTGMSAVSTCGNPSTIPTSGGVLGVFYTNYVLPPSPLPTDAAGAYLQITFPFAQTPTYEGVVLEVLPVWYNPSATAALSQNVQPTPTAEVQRPMPEQQADSMRSAMSHETDFVNALAAAVQNEQRDYAWAQQTETGLRKSFASTRLAAGGLKSVDCRSSKCDIQLQLGATKSLQAATDQQTAITRWISAGTPCSYTVVPRQDPLATSAAVMHIYLTCNK